MFFLFLSSVFCEVEKAVVLSHHDVIAEFERIEHIPCRFRTSLCPDHCDHATDVAVFKVISYNNYALNDKYGDEKQEIIHVDVKKTIYGQDPAVAQLALTLQKGQRVHLEYDHLYLTDGGSKYPVRPCTKLEIVNDSNL